MNRNTMIILLAGIAVAAIAVGYWIYTDQTRSGIEVNVGGGSLTIRER